MAKQEMVRQEGGAYAALVAATDPVARYDAGTYAMELLPVPGFRFPVPRFFFDLPWAEDNDETVAQILVNLASAPDIEEATAKTELRKIEDICNQAVTVVDLRAAESDVEDARWGAFLQLAVRLEDGSMETFSSGHQQVCVTLWRCYCEGRLPVSGVFRKLGKAKTGRSQPVGFQVESAL